MKKNTLTFVAVISAILVLAQSPQAFKYQAVVRDNLGAIVANQEVSFRISIRDVSASGAVLYQETHIVITDAFGHANLEIGNGDPPITGFIKDIDWGSNDKFMEVELDPLGNTAYVSMGTTQLLAVPYSLYAESTGDTSRWRKNMDDLYYLDGKVGIGTLTPEYDIDIYSNSTSASRLRLSNLDYSKTIFFSSGSDLFDPSIYFQGGDALRFMRYDGSYHELMRIQSNGNLGIGTGNPTEMLEVADTIYSSVGGFKFPDGTVQETAASNGGGNTLDQAYNQGGAGSGRTIIADAGALHVSGTDGVLFSGTPGSGSIPTTGMGGRMMWYPNKSAFRAGYVTGDQWDDANIGGYSAAMGYNAQANGSNSIALGPNTISSGLVSIAMGNNSQAIGNYSTAFGVQTIASGNYSTAIGREIEAAGVSTVAISLNDQNGLIVSQDNTMAVMGGKVGIEESAPTAELQVGGTDGVLFTGTYGNGIIPVEGAGTRMMWYPDKAAFRAGYVTGLQWNDVNIGDYSTSMGSNTIASGPGSVALGSETIANANVSTALGISTTASGDYSTSMGSSTTASGDISTAMGSGTTASGGYSTALGRNSIASSSYATAMGYNTTASGSSSIAMGYNTESSGNYSTAQGSHTTASGNYSTAIGRGIEVAGEYSVAIALDNQTDTVVTQNNTMAIIGGRVGIGTTSPSAGLHLGGTGYPNSFMFIEGATGNDAGIRFYEGSTDKWHIFNNVSLDGLQIYNDNGQNVFFAEQTTGHVGIGTTNPSYKLHTVINGSSEVAMFENQNQGTDSDGIIVRAGPILNPSYGVDYVIFQDGNGTTIGQIDGDDAGGVRYVTTSDARLKTNISNYTGGLDKVSQIKVRNYERISAPGIERIGLIAQELQKVYPQAVSGSNVSDVNEEPMMVDYGRITPVLVSAIQEQQELIRKLERRIDELEKKVSSY